MKTITFIVLSLFSLNSLFAESFTTTYQATNNSAILNLGSTSVQELFVPILSGVFLKDIGPNFGDQRESGRTHEGQDIMAPKGVKIVSPTDAVVLSKGTWPGAGYYVSTQNPGGENFVYMHLDQDSILKEGDVMKTGDLIGYVGNSGNAAGGAPHLHFEIRKDGIPTDPFLRLKRDLTDTEKTFFTNKTATTTFATSSSNIIISTTSAISTTSTLLATSTANITPLIKTQKNLKVPRQTLTLNDKNNEVKVLQNFLIAKNSGPFSKELFDHGVTDLFGPLTKKALIEYQKNSNISPASGKFGATTRKFMESNK